MKLFSWFPAVVLLVLLTVGCGGSGGSNDATATVNAINVKYGAPGMSVVIDGRTVLNGLQYGERAVFKLDAGSRSFGVRSNDVSTVEYTNTYTLADNSRRNLIVLSDGIYADVPTLTPSVSQLSLRFVDGRQLATKVDVYVTSGGTDLTSPVTKWEGIEFKDPAREVVLGAGAYRLIVTSTGTNTVVADSGRITPGAGTESLFILQLGESPSPAGLVRYTSNLY